MDISVIIPTYNEEETIGKTLDAISRLVNVTEIVIVDGGSTDRTVEIAEQHVKIKNTLVVNFGEANRGRQMHEGTKHAMSEILWFIFADARPLQGSANQIKKYLRNEEISGGHFEVRFSGESAWARLMNWLIPHLRSIGLVYGESAIFTRRDIYQKCGGFRNLPKFEDVDLVYRLRKQGRFVFISMPVTISSRRFVTGPYFLKFSKWSIRQTLYWFGVPPKYLSREYKPIR